MFEALLEKILLSIFGRFIENIKREHIQLGLFKGNLVIKDVKLRKDVLDYLELPLELQYSQIQQIQLLITWDKILPQMIEIRIKNVFLLVTPKEQSNWMLNKINNFDDKSKLIQEYVRKTLEEMKKNQKEEINSQEYQFQDLGLIQKTIIKIIDNLSVIIQDVHLRYEHTIGHPFSWGITIHKIEQNTMDENWRFKEKHERNSKKPNFINKQISLERLAMYWNPEDPQLFYKMKEEQIQYKMMHELIFEPELTNHQTLVIQKQSNKTSKYIYCLNAIMQVVQAYQHQFKVPEYSINVELQAMDFKIKDSYVHQMLKLMQLFTEYQQSLKSQRDRYKIIIIKPDKNNFQNKPIKLYYQSYFTYLVNRIRYDNIKQKYIAFYLRSFLMQKSTPIKVLSKQEYIKYFYIVIKAPIENLYEWSMTAVEIKRTAGDLPKSNRVDTEDKKETVSSVKANDKQRRKEQEDREKQKKKEDELQSLIREILVKKQDQTIDKEQYIFLELKLTMSKGTLKLMRKQKHQEEGFTVIWHKFELQFKKRENNYENEIVLQDLEVQMFSLEEKNDIVVPIVKKFKNFQYQDKPLVYLKIEKHPLFKQNIFSSFQLDIQQIEIILYIASFNRILSYFRVPATEQRAPIRVQDANIQRVGTALTTQKSELKVTVQAPIIIIPNQQINDFNSDCWVLRLGDLDLQSIVVEDAPQFVHVNTRQSTQRRGNTQIDQSPINNRQSQQNKFTFSTVSNQKDTENIYDHYQLDLKQVQLQYFSSMHYFYNYQKFSQTPKGMELLNHPLRVKSTKLDIIQELSITLKIHTINRETQLQKPQTKIIMDLPLLRATLTPLVPITIQKLTQVISNFSKDQTLSSILQKEKAKLFKYSSFKAYVKRRGAFYRSWQTYFCVLSGWFLYLYHSENDNDYDTYISLRDVQVSDSSQDIGVNYSFRLKNKKEIIYFQAKNHQDQKKWIKFIQQKLSLIRQKLGISSNIQMQIPKQGGVRNSNQESFKQSMFIQDTIKIQSKYRFIIRQFEIILKYENQMQDTLVQITKIKLKSLQRINESFFQFSIQKLSIRDEDKIILESISQKNSNSIHNSPLFHLQQANQNVDKFYKKFNKMEKIIESLKFSQKVALNFRTFYHNETNDNLSDSLLLISDLQLTHKSAFVNKLTKFFSKIADDKVFEKEEEQIDLDFDILRNRNISNLHQNILISQIGLDKSVRDSNDNFLGKSIKTQKSSKSFQNQRSQNSDVDERSIIAKKSILTILSKDIRVVLANNKKLEIVLVKVSNFYSKIESTLTENDIEGHIKSIELIDLNSVGQQHIFLGCRKTEKKQPTSIFSKKQQQEKEDDLLQMVKFSVRNLSQERNPDDRVFNDIDITISQCYIDYLHQTIIGIQNYVNEHTAREQQQPKSKSQQEVFEAEKDFDQLQSTISHPKLMRLSLNMVNPQIYLKPLNSSDQQFQLLIQNISLQVKNKLDRSRVNSHSKLSKRQSQSVAIDQVWSQIIELSLDRMQLQIKQLQFVEEISNDFSSVIRYQAPLFLHEYEILYPNLVIDKTKDIRVKLSSVEMNMQRHNFLFFMEIIKSQMEPSKPAYRSQKNIERGVETNQQSKQDMDQIIVFGSEELILRLLDQSEQSNIQLTQNPPIIDFKLMNIQVFLHQKSTGEKEFVFQIEQLLSNYYQYEYDNLKNIVTIQGIINNIVNEKKQVSKFITQLKQKQQQDFLHQIDQIKQEYYENYCYNEQQDQLIQIKGVIDRLGKKDIQINVSEFKFLLNSYYFTTIQNFFKVEKQLKQQSSADQQGDQEELLELNNIDFSLKKVLICVKGKGQQCIAIQSEIYLKLNEIVSEEEHKLYHVQQSIDYPDDNQFYDSLLYKTRIVKVLVKDVQIFSSQFDKLATVNLSNLQTIRKRQILRPTSVEFLSQSFTCQCNHMYLQDIRENTLKVEKIRIHIGCLDMINITDTMKFQQQQTELAQKLFSDVDDNLAYSENEDNQQEDSVQMKKIEQSQEFGGKSELLKRLTRRSLLHNIQQLKLKSQKSHINEDIFVDKLNLEQSSDFDQGSPRVSPMIHNQISKRTKIKRNRNSLSRSQIIMETFELVIINDVSLSYVPLLLVNLAMQRLILEDNTQTRLIDVQIAIGIFYFNPIASKMEPILEQTDFKLDIIQNHESYPKLCLLLEKKLNQQAKLCNAVINFNISAQMLITLSKSIKLWSQKFNENEAIKENRQQSQGGQLWRRIETKQLSKLMITSNHGKDIGSQRAIPTENQDKVTLFTVVNKTGYNLRIEKQNTSEKQNETMDITNDDSRNYIVDSDEQDYAKTFEQEYKVAITFYDWEQNLFEIDSAPVDSVITKRLHWIHKGQITKNYFICQTQIENLNKTVLLLSQYMITNKTDCYLIIRLSQQGKNLKVIQLDTDEQQAIPIEFLNSFVTLIFNDKKYSRNSQLSEPFSLLEILNKQQTEISHGIFYTQIVKRMEQGVTYLDLKPYMKIINCLPIPIQLSFSSNLNNDLHQQVLTHHLDCQSQIKQSQPAAHKTSLQPPLNNFQSFPSNSEFNFIMQRSVSMGSSHNENHRIEDGFIQIQPQSEFQLHQISQIDNLELQVRINGFNVSNKFSVNQVKNVKLKDGDDYLKLYIEKDFAKISKLLYFYIHTCIINITPHQLWYHTLINNQKQNLPGQIRKQQRSCSNFEKQYDQVLVCNKFKNLMISLDQIDITNEVNVQILGSFNLQLKQISDKPELYEFGVHISVQRLQIKGFYTKVIEIMPRYVIINCTNYTLNICQSGCEFKPIVMSPEQRIPIVWSDCRQEKSIRLQGTDKQQKWTWSGDLFVSEIRSTYFYTQPTSVDDDNNQFSFNIKNSNQKKSTTQTENSIYSRFQIKKYDPSLLERHKDNIMKISNISRPLTEFSKEAIFLNAEVTKVKATHYIVIKSSDETSYAYKLFNKCQKLKLVYSQDAFQSKEEYVLNQFRSTPFAWEFPSHSYKLKVKFISIQSEQLIHTEIIDFQELKTLRSQQMMIDGQETTVKIKIEFQGSTRCIIFDDHNESAEMEEDVQIEKMININIDSIGISLMLLRNQQILEGNYIYLKFIQLGIIQTQENTTFQLRVKFLNIDNNSSPNTTTPIILSVSRCLQALNDPKYYFLETSFQQDHRVQAIQLFHFVRLSIQPITVQLDEDFINVILESLKYYQTHTKSELEDISELNGLLQSVKALVFQKPSQREYSLKLMSEFKEENPFLLWNTITISSSRKLMYIKELLLPPIEIVFSFHKKFHSTSDSEENLFNLFSTAIGTSVQNINEAQINLMGLRMNMLYDSTDVINQSLQDHYKGEIIKNVLKILGSFEIIGNPVGLIQQISVGVVDFVEKPIEGLKNGPLEFGYGIVLGTGSLLKNTVAGAFYSLNKFTGSISASVSLLSMDDEYLEQRRVFMLKKPNHIIDGLAQASQSIYRGFSDGITGLVMQPYRESQKDGVTGFIKGTIKGISGLVVKPVSGVLDASAKAAETVAITATHFDDKPNDQRIRNPRPFYERSKYFTKYQEKDARVMSLLNRIQNGKYSKIDYKECYEQVDDQHQIQRRLMLAAKQLDQCFYDVSKILILSYQFILIIDMQLNIVQEFQPNRIKDIQLKDDQLLIDNVALMINLRDLKQVYKSIKYLQEQVRHDN